jgi:hypothetical protein
MFFCRCSPALHQGPRLVCLWCWTHGLRDIWSPRSRPWTAFRPFLVVAGRTRSAPRRPPSCRIWTRRLPRSRSCTRRYPPGGTSALVTVAMQTRIAGKNCRPGWQAMIATMNVAMIAAMNVARIAAMNVAMIAAMSVAMIAAMIVAMFAAMIAPMIVAMFAAMIAAMIAPMIASHGRWSAGGQTQMTALWHARDDVGCSATEGQPRGLEGQTHHQNLQGRHDCLRVLARGVARVFRTVSGRVVGMVGMGSIVSRLSTQREQKYCRGRGQEELSSCASARAPVFASASAAGLALWRAGGEYAAIHRAHGGLQHFAVVPSPAHGVFPRAKSGRCTAPHAVAGQGGEWWKQFVRWPRARPTSEDGMPCHHGRPSTRATASPEVSSILVMALPKRPHARPAARALVPRGSPRASISSLPWARPTARCTLTLAEAAHGGPS